MAKEPKNAVILLSGGIDSTACVHYYLEQKFNVKALFIDFGQKAHKAELASAEKIAKHFKVPLLKLQFQFPLEYPSGEILGRNAFLVLSSIMLLQKYHGLIALGIHSGTPYYDCSESFVISINELLRGYSGGRILLDAPFQKWTKKMIMDYCLKNKIPINLTYSCENGTIPQCGKCLSCKDRRVLNAQ
jgi:7-cyano-7-deazaguanine synthase